MPSTGARPLRCSRVGLRPCAVTNDALSLCGDHSGESDVVSGFPREHCIHILGRGLLDFLVFRWLALVLHKSI
jgi:hypothetical protein